MTSYVYDPDNYLTSVMFSLKSYVTDQLHANEAILDTVDVEMGFPVQRDNWTKKQPLARSVVHLVLDDDPEVRVGFGVPVTQSDNDDGTTVLTEPALHELNFDVGIWTSAQSGGEEMRARLRQALYGIFGYATARQALTAATDGLVVRSYGGGNDVLDRVNDLPVYRTTSITLVLRVFSRYTFPVPVDLVGSFDQYQKLSIQEGDGSLQHVTTDEDPWTS